MWSIWLPFSNLLLFMNRFRASWSTLCPQIRPWRRRGDTKFTKLKTKYIYIQFQCVSRKYWLSNNLFTAFGANSSRQPISVYARAYIYFMNNLEAHDAVIILFPTEKIPEKYPIFSYLRHLMNKYFYILEFQTSCFAATTICWSTVSIQGGGAETKGTHNGWIEPTRFPLDTAHVFGQRTFIIDSGYIRERCAHIDITGWNCYYFHQSAGHIALLDESAKVPVWWAKVWNGVRELWVENITSGFRRIFCWRVMNVGMIIISGMYNITELQLHWESKSPVTIAPELHLTEYILASYWTNETVVNADLSDLRHGAFGNIKQCIIINWPASNSAAQFLTDGNFWLCFPAGNYSSLSFTVHLVRESGFYIMDYFLPSMMIVAISWVSFWLQADQSPPRIMLGTSTMLTFITLASAQGKTLPKVSYIKVSEVWFLGCCMFIFGSLVEFAFVNTIWRRKRTSNWRR